MTGADLAAAAEGLVGTPFRLHGRSCATGLDCIGLVGASLEACGIPARYPQGYRLRNSDISGWLHFAQANGLAAVTGAPMPGDVLLTQPGPGQHHLLVALGNDRFVHAHAGLRRVVCQRLTLDKSPLAHWRPGADPEQIWQP